VKSKANPRSTTGEIRVTHDAIEVHVTHGIVNDVGFGPKDRGVVVGKGLRTRVYLGRKRFERLATSSFGQNSTHPTHTHTPYTPYTHTHTPYTPYTHTHTHTHI